MGRTCSCLLFYKMVYKAHDIFFLFLKKKITYENPPSDLCRPIIQTKESGREDSKKTRMSFPFCLDVFPFLSCFDNR